MIVSKRLVKIAECMEYAESVADIGTDHAYLPITLIKSGKASHVIAMDVREKPLKRACDNIAMEGLEDKISVRLSDGADKLSPKEVQVISITGMGGDLMGRIISERPEVFQNIREMYLSPQSEVYLFRKKLMDMEYYISDEWIVMDDGKYYFIIKASFGHEDNPYSEIELKYGRKLIEKKDYELYRYLCREKEINERVLKKLISANTNAANERMEQISKEMNDIIDTINTITD